MEKIDMVGAVGGARMWGAEVAVEAAWDNGHGVVCTGYLNEKRLLECRDTFQQKMEIIGGSISSLLKVMDFAGFSDENRGFARMTIGALTELKSCYAHIVAKYDQAIQEVRQFTATV